MSDEHLDRRVKDVRPLRVLIAILSCQANRKSRQKAIEETWASSLPGGFQAITVEAGHRECSFSESRLHLACSDAYEDLAEKVACMLRYLNQFVDFDVLIKCDDDVLLRPEGIPYSLLRADYAGLFAHGGGGPHCSYACGPLYILSKRSVKVLCDSLGNGISKRWSKNGRRPNLYWEKSSSVEDMMVGDTLREHGIPLTETYGISLRSRPHPFESSLIFACQTSSPLQMKRMHLQGKASEVTVMSIVIGTIFTVFHIGSVRIRKILAYTKIHRLVAKFLHLKNHIFE